jgi:hypothetical protein
MGGLRSMLLSPTQLFACLHALHAKGCRYKHMRVRLGARVRNRVASQAARDGTGQQPRSGKMAGTRMQNAMVGACHAAWARRDARATPDCLMARMVPLKP